MMLDEVILKRKSVRKFQDREVDGSLLLELVDMARRGPSAGAIRGYEVIITRDLKTYMAPICVVICVNKEPYISKYGDRGKMYAIQDSAIFGAYLQLLLVDRGLDSCWVGAFREDRTARVIGTNLQPVAIIAIGYKE